jgi:hypothetical protein
VADIVADVFFCGDTAGRQVMQSARFRINFSRGLRINGLKINEPDKDRIKQNATNIFNMAVPPWAHALGNPNQNTNRNQNPNSYPCELNGLKIKVIKAKSLNSSNSYQYFSSQNYTIIIS